MAEAKKKLVPPRPRPEAPRTLPEALGRIREDPSFPALAVDWMASALEDRKSYSGFKARCEEAWRGDLPVPRLLSAFEQRRLARWEVALADLVEVDGSGANERPRRSP